jgi:D-psicose/D-tagatose/L-ribulose 3-epimerase
VLFVFPFTTRDSRLFTQFKRWGFDAVELLIADPDDIDPAQVRTKLESAGLACGSVCGAMNPDRDLRGNARSQRNGVRFLCQLLDQMLALDCKVLGGPMYSYVGRAEGASRSEYRSQWKTVVANLKTVAAHAEANGQTLCIEPLNRFETDFLNTIGQGLQLLDDIGSPAVKLHLDTFHANIEEKNLPAAIRRAGRHLGLIHACGCDRGTPGNDHLDWKGMGTALKAIGYQGDVVIESVTLDVPLIARSAAIWRRMEPTRDEIASEGLKFLKRTFRPGIR